MSIPQKRESVASQILAERSAALERGTRMRQFVFTFVGDTLEKGGEKLARIRTQRGSFVVEGDFTLPELQVLIKGAEKARAHWLLLSLKEPIVNQMNLEVARSNYKALVAARDALQKLR